MTSTVDLQSQGQADYFITFLFFLYIWYKPDLYMSIS